MNNLLDKFICIFINLFIFFIWIFFIVISSDIPINIEKFDFLIALSFILVSLVIYSIYLRKTKYKIINLLILLPITILWFISTKQAIKFDYHIYNTSLSILGFISNLLISLQILFIKFKNNK